MPAAEETRELHAPEGAAHEQVDSQVNGVSDRNEDTDQQKIQEPHQVAPPTSDTSREEEHQQDQEDVNTAPPESSEDFPLQNQTSPPAEEAQTKEVPASGILETSSENFTTSTETTSEAPTQNTPSSKNTETTEAPSSSSISQEQQGVQQSTTQPQPGKATQHTDNEQRASSAPSQQGALPKQSSSQAAPHNEKLGSTEDQHEVPSPVPVASEQQERPTVFPSTHSEAPRQESFTQELNQSTGTSESSKKADVSPSQQTNRDMLEEQPTHQNKDEELAQTPNQIPPTSNQQQSLQPQYHNTPPPSYASVRARNAENNIQSESLPDTETDIDNALPTQDQSSNSSLTMDPLKDNRMPVENASGKAAFEGTSGSLAQPVDSEPSNIQPQERTSNAQALNAETVPSPSLSEDTGIDQAPDTIDEPSNELAPPALQTQASATATGQIPAANTQSVHSSLGLSEDSNLSASVASSMGAAAASPSLLPKDDEDDKSQTLPEKTASNPVSHLNEDHKPPEHAPDSSSQDHNRDENLNPLPSETNTPSSEHYNTLSESAEERFKAPVAEEDVSVSKVSPSEQDLDDAPLHGSSTAVDNARNAYRSNTAEGTLEEAQPQASEEFSPQDFKGNLVPDELDEEQQDLGRNVQESTLEETNNLGSVELEEQQDLGRNVQEPTLEETNNQEDHQYPNSDAPSQIQATDDQDNTEIDANEMGNIDDQDKSKVDADNANEVDESSDIGTLSNSSDDANNQGIVEANGNNNEHIRDHGGTETDADNAENIEHQSDKEADVDNSDNINDPVAENVDTDNQDVIEDNTKLDDQHEQEEESEDVFEPTLLLPENPPKLMQEIEGSQINEVDVPEDALHGPSGEATFSISGSELSKDTLRGSDTLFTMMASSDHLYQNDRPDFDNDDEYVSDIDKEFDAEDGSDRNDYHESQSVELDNLSILRRGETYVAPVPSELQDAVSEVAARSKAFKAKSREQVYRVDNSLLEELDEDEEGLGSVSSEVEDNTAKKAASLPLPPVELPIVGAATSTSLEWPDGSKNIYDSKTTSQNFQGASNVQQIVANNGESMKLPAYRSSEEEECSLHENAYDGKRSYDDDANDEEEEEEEVLFQAKETHSSSNMPTSPALSKGQPRSPFHGGNDPNHGNGTDRDVLEEFALWLSLIKDRFHGPASFQREPSVDAEIAKQRSPMTYSEDELSSSYNSLVNPTFREGLSSAGRLSEMRRRAEDIKVNAAHRHAIMQSDSKSRMMDSKIASFIQVLRLQAEAHMLGQRDSFSESVDSIEDETALHLAKGIVKTDSWEPLFACFEVEQRDAQDPSVKADETFLSVLERQVRLRNSINGELVRQYLNVVLRGLPPSPALADLVKRIPTQNVALSYSQSPDCAYKLGKLSTNFRRIFCAMYEGLFMPSMQVRKCDTSQLEAAIADLCKFMAVMTRCLLWQYPVLIDCKVREVLGDTSKGRIQDSRRGGWIPRSTKDQMLVVRSCIEDAIIDPLLDNLYLAYNSICGEKDLQVGKACRQLTSKLKEQELMIACGVPPFYQLEYTHPVARPASYRRSQEQPASPYQGAIDLMESVWINTRTPASKISVLSLAHQAIVDAAIMHYSRPTEMRDENGSVKVRAAIKDQRKLVPRRREMLALFTHCIIMSMPPNLETQSRLLFDLGSRHAVAHSEVAAHAIAMMCMMPRSIEEVANTAGVSII